MTWLIVASTLVVTLLLALYIGTEHKRRKKWFLDARAALGDSFSPFEKRIGTDRRESAGKLEGREAVFAADETTTEARLDVPLAAGIERGRVFDLIVREAEGLHETGREDVLVGWDDEHGRLSFRTRCDRDAAKTVEVLREEEAAFQKRLPAVLDESERARAKARSESATPTFGELTGPDGRHALLGLGLVLPAERWELATARPEVVDWEMVPPEEGEALPVELRLLPVAFAEPLNEEGARLALLDRIAHAYVDRQPDESFEGKAPEPEAESAGTVGGFPAARASVDHLREVVLEDEQVARKPYRALIHATFAPWGVAVLELVAPRDRAGALLDELLRGATFEKPAKG